MSSGARLGLLADEGHGSGRGTGIDYQSSIISSAYDHDAILLTVCARISSAYLNSSSSIEEKAGPQSGNLKRNPSGGPKAPKGSD